MCCILLFRDTVWQKVNFISNQWLLQGTHSRAIIKRGSLICSHKCLTTLSKTSAAKIYFFHNKLITHSKIDYWKIPFSIQLLWVCILGCNSVCYCVDINFESWILPDIKIYLWNIAIVRFTNLKPQQKRTFDF